MDRGAPGRLREKEELADDVLALLDALGLDRVFLIGHDWGALAGFFLCLRAPGRVERYVALNDVHPWLRPSLLDALHAWRLWYQWVLATPALGTWLLRNRPGFVKGLFRAWSARDVWSDQELEVFAQRLREPERARASALYHRTLLLKELLPILAGQYRRRRLRTPTLLLFAADDGVIRPHQLSGYETHADDMRLELIPGAGHFTPEEATDLALERAMEHFEPLRSGSRAQDSRSQ